MSELALGVVLGFVATAACGAIAGMAVALLLAYEAGGLKRAGLPGNVVIGLLTGLLFVTGGAAAGSAWRPASLAAAGVVVVADADVVAPVVPMANCFPRSRALPTSRSCRPATSP